jgi:tetratricopeptide (TPR) repeat protein
MMFLITHCFSYVLAGVLAGFQTPVSDVPGTLAAAEAAYYGARYNETIDMLTPLDQALALEPERTVERVRVKLQLGLAYIALNQTSEAKARFLEIYDLNPGFSLDDSGRFAPKVLEVLQEAKTQHEARTKQLARALYKDAVDLYKEGDLPQALTKIQTALQLDPGSDAMLDYLALIENSLRLSIDSARFDWRKYFQAGDFAGAWIRYRELQSLNVENRAADALEGAQTEYRKALAAMAQTWTEACSAQDRPSMDRIKSKIQQIAPDGAVAPEIFARIDDCSAPAPAAQRVVNTPSPTETQEGCLQTSHRNAMARIKTVVNPQVNYASLPHGSLQVRAKIRIDEQGNTSVQELHGGIPTVNKAVKGAVEQWKFYPALVDKQPRCVETEVPIVLHR